MSRHDYSDLPAADSPRDPNRPGVPETDSGDGRPDDPAGDPDGVADRGDGLAGGPQVRARLPGPLDLDPNKESFGVWPQIAGTLLSSLLGLALGTIFGLATAIVLSQDFLPHWLEQTFANVFQILAAIPSVVYGLWGLFVVVPAIRPLANWIHAVAGGIPLFSTRLSGPGMLPTAIVLGIMVLPTIVAISRES